MKLDLNSTVGSCTAALITGGIAAFTSVGLLLAEAAFVPARAAQQFFCNGRMNNGWAYNAEYVDGRFTQIRWNRSAQPPQTTNLSFVSTNAQGQPVYRGSFQGATAVTLVDLSGGNVRPGSQVSVGAEEWGWSRGNCALSATNPGGSTDWFSALKQDLMGVSDTRSREWMRQNEFFFVQTVSHTNTQIVEQWHRDSDRAIVNVVLRNGVVADVSRVR